MDNAFSFLSLIYNLIWNQNYKFPLHQSFSCTNLCKQTVANCNFHCKLLLTKKFIVSVNFWKRIFFWNYTISQANDHEFFASIGIHKFDVNTSKFCLAQWTVAVSWPICPLPQTFMVPFFSGLDSDFRVKEINQD